MMKYIRLLFIWLLVAALALSLVACSEPPPPTPGGQHPPLSDPIDVEGMNLSDPERTSTPSYDPLTVNTGVQNGITKQGNVYTITKGGDYTLSGHLDGQILVSAPKEEKVKLILNGVYLHSSELAPIVCLSADELTLKAESNTYNVIEDNRSDTSSVTEDGAVYSKDDLTFSGRGILIIHTRAARGAHSTNDITVKNVTLKVRAVDTALRGDDSVTVESGSLLLISEGEDGIKTQNSDLSSKGKQRGDVTFLGGTVHIYAYADGIQAVHDVLVQATAHVRIRCGNFGTYPPTDTPSTDALTHSAKGIKADNKLDISGGVLDVQSTDDAVKTTKDTFLESGEKTLGNVSVSGGFTRLRSANDCLDITGDISMSDGYLVLEALTQDPLAAYALKVIGSMSVTGGTMLLFGSQRGGENIAALTPSFPLSAGVYTLQNADEDVLCFTLYGERSSLCMLCPTLSDGEYTLSKGDTSLTFALADGSIIP